MAYTRLLAGLSCPDCASTEAVLLEAEKLGGSSYSSFVPTTMSGVPSWSRSPMAGEFTILLPRKGDGAPGIGATRSWVASTTIIRVESTTRTGKPGSSAPRWFHT